MRYWKKLTLASKIMIIIWTIVAANMIFVQGTGDLIAEDIATWIFGYIVFVGITQAISVYIKNKNRRRINPPNNQYYQYQAPAPQPMVQRDYDSMEGHEFEYFCADLLRKNGFVNVEVTKGSGDQGIDIIAYKDGMKYGIQCKCYTSDIGNKAVQEAYAGKEFYGCHVVAVLTNRYFTKSAKELAQSNKVLLWNRDVLNDFIEKSMK